ncbi:expressed unknown protein [Seminavis robusta]|uniref:Uncharacterized protein n=1 Tax=Seminavis robusta TaxID=568900 RepID=A0A9N8D7I6_9STRA|nr:expressed unknown protein [Seminavis robusta]|eukprot:Sro29_g019300.1 n/a (71) ;mRNA; f:142877-143260
MERRPTLSYLGVTGTVNIACIESTCIDIGNKQNPPNDQTAQLICAAGKGAQRRWLHLKGKDESRPSPWCL